MNIDKKIETILNNGFYRDEIHTRMIWSKIKQSILKAIMKKKLYYKENEFYGMGNFDYAFKKIYDQAIKDYESVIKEVLSEAKK